MGGLFQSFPDPETERAFLRAERSERGQAIRALIVIAIATLLSYIVINPMHFPPRRGDRLHPGGGRPDRADARLLPPHPHANSIWTSPGSTCRSSSRWPAAMKWLALVLAGLAPFTGFPPHVMAMVQMAILMVFASVGFAGTFRLFLIWAFGAAGAVRALADDAARHPRHQPRLHAHQFLDLLRLRALLQLGRRPARAQGVRRQPAALEAERAKTEELLYNVLPQEVAARLRAGEAVADSFSDLTAIFVDLAGFSTLAKRLSPGHLVKMLNTFFSAADRCAERHGLEKVKTIGDAYLAVAGGMASAGSDGKAAILFARDLIAELVAIAAEKRPAAAGADRHPYRPGGRRRDRQRPASLTIIGATR